MPNKVTVARIHAANQLSKMAVDQCVTPLAAMLENLQFYHSSAMALTEKLQAAAELMTPEQIAGGGAEVMELLKLVSRVGDFRMKAQACAVDAAPYVHPRLASMEFKQQHDDPLEKISQLMSPKEAAEIYRKTLDITPSKVPA
jgi:hypothetical protein